MRGNTFLTALLVLLAVSCAPLPRDLPPELYWPFPPERPRVKFLDYVFGSRDVTGVREGKFKQVLFGDSEEVRFFKPLFITKLNNVMYVTDLFRVMVFNYNNNSFITTGLGVLRNATGIGVVSDGRIYVGDSAMHRVILLRPGTDEALIIGDDTLLKSPGGLAMDEKNDRFFVVDAKMHTLNAFSLDGEHLFTVGKRGNLPGQFNYPYDVTFGPDGNLYVSDTGNFRVQIFSPEGKFLSSFGAVGSEPGMFSRPKGIALNSQGYLFVVDSGFANFQILDTDGTAYLAVGSNGIEPGKFLLPFGIHIDKDDKIYVVDTINRRVQVFQYIKYDDENLKAKPVNAFESEGAEEGWQ